MSVSIKDIAKIGNVSTATVSLVLNNVPGVSEKKRAEIKKLIKEHNYIPNSRARSFSVGRAGVIALIMPPWQASFSDPYFTEMLRGALEGVRDKNYQLMIEICDTRFLDHLLWKDLFESKKIDGMLIATPYLDQQYVRELHKAGYPAILLNGERPDLTDMHCVGYDDYHCGLEATNYLLKLGHHKIAHIAGPANQASAINRIEGYKDAIRAAGLPLLDEYIVDGNYMPIEAREALKKLLVLGPEKTPTAFFCANDTMAISVINYLKECGHQIPRDFSVIGVDDNVAGRSIDPPLTTFRQDIFSLTQHATDLFLGAITKKKKTELLKVRLPMELVVRSSCARFAADSESLA